MFTRILVPAGAILVAGVIGFSQTTLKKVPISSTNPGEGAEMYQAYCSACHGADGKGQGPAKAALKTPPPDLTLLTRQNNGEFPSHAVRYTLGVNRGGAHGSADMPMWGDVFRFSGQADHTVQMRIYNLTRFLEGIQEPAEKPAKEPKSEKAQPARVRDISAVSGASMYQAFCASCHGIDGSGGGPAAASLKTPAADLTRLTATHKGEFPAFHVQEVLGVMRGREAAHGSKDMPVWGDAFRASGEDNMIVQLRIRNLTDYLRSIQR